MGDSTSAIGRTSVLWSQNPRPYRLATPHHFLVVAVTSMNRREVGRICVCAWGFERHLRGLDGPDKRPAALTFSLHLKLFVEVGLKLREDIVGPNDADNLAPKLPGS